MSPLTDRLGLPNNRGLRIVVTRAHADAEVTWLVLAASNLERFA